MASAKTADVLLEVMKERERQDAKWGEQHHKDGTGGLVADREAMEAQALTNRRAQQGRVTWRDILDEEVKEAFAEDDEKRLRAELLQVAAVAAAWVEDIDTRPNHLGFKGP